MEGSYYKKYEPFFGSWYIQREIGAGSFGRVFEIRREDFGKTYRAALKAISIPATESELKGLLADGMDEDSVASYCRSMTENVADEFAIMSDLKGNSNIVSYEDHMVIPWENGIGYDILIRMELLTPLPDYITEQGFSTKDVIRLGIDVCRALELCQKRDIIHRDIKPSNIFVSDNGDYKLGDFGVARTLEQTIGGMSQKGTYTYMAPEVYRGENYDGRADIYSLGIVLYRFLNENRQPFLPLPPEPITFEAQQRAQNRMYTGDIIPEPINGSVELTALLRKACSLRAEGRFSGPGELRQALEEALHSTKDAVVLHAKDRKVATEKNSESTQTISVFGAEVPAEPKISEDSMVQETVGIDWSSKGKGTEQATRGKKAGALRPEKKNGSKKIVGVIAGAVVVLLAAVGLYAYSVYNETETIYAPVSMSWNDEKGTFGDLFLCYDAEFHYDRDGNIVEILYYDDKGLQVKQSEFTYNEDGQPLTGEDIYLSGTIAYQVYEYDSQGRFVKYISVWNDQESICYYSYNNAGELESKTVYQDDILYCRYNYQYEWSEDSCTVTEYSYDQYGEMSDDVVTYYLQDNGKTLVCKSGWDVFYNWWYDSAGYLEYANYDIYGGDMWCYDHQIGEIEVRKGTDLLPKEISRKFFMINCVAHDFFPTQLNR